MAEDKPPPGPADGEIWAREALEPDQIAAGKHRYGLAPLSRGKIVLLWALRVYVLLMIALIVYQICQAMRGPR